MTQKDELFSDFHWLMDALQTIDVGLVVLNKSFEIELWNSFMQNHSGLMPSEVLSKNIFKTFPELPEQWFTRKAQTVLVLKNATFTTWEQRPYLFKFKHYRPITGVAKHMYQNSTIIPLLNTRGEVERICLIIYDVTDTAVNSLELKAANEKLAHISQTDILTGLFNRGYWEERLIEEHQRFKRYQDSCSLVFFDIDHFKKVNDTYGHPAGDEVIRLAAQTVLKEIRDVDIAGRYGGEEFGIILPKTPIKGALEFAERLRKKIETTPIVHDGKTLNCTISLGVSEITAEFGLAKDWLEATDKALYSAKAKGRNCLAYHQA